MKKYNLFLLVANTILIGVIVLCTICCVISKNYNLVSNNKDVVTYKSKKLCVSFDIPSKYIDDYIIDESDRELKINIKNDSKCTDSVLVITSDTKAYNRGKDINPINGRSKYKSINNCGYLLGVLDKDSESNSFAEDIISTLR